VVVVVDTLLYTGY